MSHPRLSAFTYVYSHQCVHYTHDRYTMAFNSIMYYQTTLHVSPLSISLHYTNDRYTMTFNCIMYYQTTLHVSPLSISIHYTNEIHNDI